MVDTANVAFNLRSDPKSFFYDLILDFEGRVEEIGGYDFTPEDELMRGALMVALGHPDSINVRLARAPNEGARLVLRGIDLNYADRADGPPRWGCEISRVELDSWGEPESAPLVLGVTPSLLQFARAALDFGEACYGDLPPSTALLALRAAMPVLEAAGR
jgi:hypothetical protein